MSTTTPATPNLEGLNLEELLATDDSDMLSELSEIDIPSRFREVDTVAELSESVRPVRLVRNGCVDSPMDYIHIFIKLQLRRDFETGFFALMKEYRSWEAVREMLADPGNDLKVVSENFLKTYGKEIWMYKGRNNKQDRKYKETYFKWNNDEDKLWGLLDELWTRVRKLCWDPPSEGTTSVPDPDETISDQQSPSLPPLPPSRSSSTVSSLDSEEEATAMVFINKVRTKIHGLPKIDRKGKQVSTEYQLYST